MEANVLPLPSQHSAQILTSDAVAFLVFLHRKFNKTRLRLLRERSDRQKRISSGEKPSFLKETVGIRSSLWRVAPCPADLAVRHVEITGPAAPSKMVINALNSGADVFMADFEDALAPTWQRVIEGQIAMRRAVRRTLEHTAPDGKKYQLKQDSKTTLVIRPRGWHLQERHMLIDGEPISASLFDFGLFFFHNAKELISRGSGPYFYLPKMESHKEARLWNSVFVAAQDFVGLPRGSIRATVLIETLLAAFEMDEILYELKDHCSGLNAGRWDYIFSAIKKMRDHSDAPGGILPDRVQVTMRAPFMRAYTQLLVQTCHRRGAHAIGGMAAFIPTNDSATNQAAFKKVEDDKELEASIGFDGTWVAHPGLIPTARQAFEKILKGKRDQKDVLLSDFKCPSDDLLCFKIDGGKITEQGLRTNIKAAVLYISAYLKGNGAASINNLMEDAATAEISRSQIWQWIWRGAKLDDGRPITIDLYKKLRDEECNTGNVDPMAVLILDSLVLREDFVDFLTSIAYDYLLQSEIKYAIIVGGRRMRTCHFGDAKPKRHFYGSFGLKVFGFVDIHFQQHAYIFSSSP